MKGLVCCSEDERFGMVRSGGLGLMDHGGGKRIV